MIPKNGKNILLVDFTDTSKWGNVDLKSLKRLVRTKIRPQSKSGRLFGTLNEPENENSDTNLSDVSHLIEDVRFKKGKLYGNLKILPTPKGEILNKLSDIDMSIKAFMIGNRDKQMTLVEDIFRFNIVPKNVNN